MGEWEIKKEEGGKREMGNVREGEELGHLRDHTDCAI